MGIESEHDVEELAGGSAETGVEIGNNDIMGSVSSGEAVESCSGVGDDGGDNDKRGVGSIKVGR